MSFLASDASWRSDLGQGLLHFHSQNYDSGKILDPYTASVMSYDRGTGISSMPTSGRRCLAAMIRCGELILHLRHAYLRDDVRAVNHLRRYLVA